MSGTNVQSPTAQTSGQSGTCKNWFTTIRPLSFAQGSEEISGLGTVPAVHTKVRHGIGTCWAKKTLSSVMLLTPGVKPNFHSAPLEHLLSVSPKAFAQLWQDYRARMHQ